MRFQTPLACFQHATQSKSRESVITETSNSFRVWLGSSKYLARCLPSLPWLWKSDVFPGTRLRQRCYQWFLWTFCFMLEKKIRLTSANIGGKQAVQCGSVYGACSQTSSPFRRRCSMHDAAPEPTLVPQWCRHFEVQECLCPGERVQLTAPLRVCVHVHFCTFVAHPKCPCLRACIQIIITM